MNIISYLTAVLWMCFCMCVKGGNQHSLSQHRILAISREILRGFFIFSLVIWGNERRQANYSTPVAEGEKKVNITSLSEES
jgi:hypothetical protein